MSALTSTEKSRLEELCGIVRKGMQTFVEVGNALMEIRESGLYRERCSTFEAFVQIEFGFSRQRAYQQIAAAETVALLSTTVDTGDVTERTIRPLTTLPPEQRVEAFEEATEVAKSEGKKKPTAAHVSAAVRLRSKERKQKSESPEDMASSIVRASEQKKAPEVTASTEHTAPARIDAQAPEVGEPTGATSTPNPADEGRGNPNARIPRPTPSHRFREFVRVAVTLEEPSAEEIAAFQTNDLMLEHLERAHRVIGLILSHNGRSVAA